MSDAVSITKDDSKQYPIPFEWRKTFIKIVEAFKKEDYGLTQDIFGVRSIPAEKAEKIAGYIKNYGARLTSLPEATWETSVCQWMRGYWDVLVDLYTVEEGASDLALAARVYEEGLSYIFEVHLVYVP